MKFKYSLVGTVALAGLWSLGMAQQSLIKNTTVSDTALSGNDKLHVLTIFSEWSPGASAPRHYLNGDEYGYVLEGQYEITPDNAPPHIYKAGEAFHNGRGEVHSTRTVGNSVVRSVKVLVVDKEGPVSVKMQ